MILTVSVALFAIMVVGCNATNYCNRALCPAGGIHIGCKNQNKFSPKCIDPNLVEFGVDRQKLILDTHNIYRNNIASGAATFASAVRMRVLTWNKELAKLAEYNVRQCIMKQDACLNTQKFPVAGQNLGYSGVQDAYFTPEMIDPLLGRIMDSWFAESESVHQAWLDRFTENTFNYVIFHFTTMIQDRGSEIGCSAATYKLAMPKGTEYTTLLLACNYSFTNIINQPVYITGYPASKCLTGHDPTYTSLCSASENISSEFKQDVEKKGSFCKTDKLHFHRKCK